MPVKLRKSDFTDLHALELIEEICFPKFQRSSKRSLITSLSSSTQEVWMAEARLNEDYRIAGALILHKHTRTLRVYSIGVLPEFQGKGIGQKLLDQACSQAMAQGYEKIVLEARASDKTLLGWYQKSGFVVKQHLPDYYCEGEDAFRLQFTVSRTKRNDPISNIIVVDNPGKWQLSVEGVRVVSAKSYLADTEFQTARNLRVFNLCNSYRYQSIGYYVSLLAGARAHRAIPSVTTIRDFKNLAVIRSIANDVDELIQKSLERVREERFELSIYFGQTVDPALRNLGHQLYLLFETPLLKITFSKSNRWLVEKVRPLKLDSVEPAYVLKIAKFANAYFARKRFQKPRLKHYKYDLAILINPSEINPPSCPAALRKFKNAANKIGFYVDFITREDYGSLGEYDALFIRETTSVNDHTYQFARRAYAEGLVVIDDPWSILRCSNKIYLYERMKQYRIETPQTEVLVKAVFKKKQLTAFKYPIILKQPDSAFSRGVIKVSNAGEMEAALEQLFRKSELVIAQEFMPSAFDWRIGMLDQKPLFACKYFMAKDHWQIYNWNESNDDSLGDAESVPVEKVPEQVLKVATRAAGLMGDGLYGVDLKEINGKVYVVEINDNPNIDSGIEDAVLGDSLYERFALSLFNRIEESRNSERLVALEK